MSDYTATMDTCRRPLDTRSRAPMRRNRELVRYATLATNSHNTQPWFFDVSEDRITVHIDRSRRCVVVDPDDHHLHVSLGCATENIVIAASGFGIVATPCIASDGASVQIDLVEEAIPASPLIAAIPLRQTTRSLFDGKPLTEAEKLALTDAAAGPDVTFHLIQSPECIAALREMVVVGNAKQMANPKFVAELVLWIRFSARGARIRRDGLFGRCLGNPSLPEWMGRVIFPFVFRVSSETAKIRHQISSASALAVFVSDRNTPVNWVETGRAFQRFALAATSLGLMNAHINQAIEVSEQRDQVATLLGETEGRPSLLLRIGRGEPMPYSYRRNVEEVMTETRKWN